LEIVIEEMELWSIVEGKAKIPTDPQELIQYEKKVAKAKRIILDSVKDHLIPHIAGKLAKEIYEAVSSLYQSVSTCPESCS
jgi:hypothetical protein